VIVEEMTLGIAWKLWSVFWGWLSEFSKRPLREGALVVLVVTLLAVIWVAIDPIRLIRERRGRESVADMEKRIRRQVREEMEISRMRELWLGNPQSACELAERLLEMIAEDLRKQGVLGAQLYVDRAAKLGDGYKRFAATLSRESLAEAKVAYEETIQLYGTCVASIHECLDAHPQLKDRLETSDGMTMIDRLKAYHADMAEKTTQLSKRLLQVGTSAVREDVERIRFWRR
jgi:hypothetical protein